jgi:triacylglycerol esterase/lipase EstA (alpha/beta hydrolase family)
MRADLVHVLVLVAGCGSTVRGAADGDDAGDPAQEDGDPEAEPSCPGPAERLERGRLAAGTELSGIALAACTEHAWALVGAAGSELVIGIEPEGPALVAAIAYPDEPSWDEPIGSLATSGGPGSLSFAPPRSGELALLVRAADTATATGYALRLECASGCGLETTRYPIVLVHGWTGWESIGSYTYFYGIPDLLAARGYPVFVASLDPYNSVEVRSEQLAEQIDGFIAEARARRVDIVAHSQGGLDSRRAISTLGRGDRVSALVTVATPHRGTPIADIALGLLPGPAEDALSFLLELVGATVVGSESDAEASFRSLTTAYVEGEFNPANPDDPRVSYASWTGITCPLGVSCDDVCDVEIRWSYDLIYLVAGDNDGMVPVSSAPWGDYRGEVPADHFDEIGQLMGVTGPSFDHEEFYLGIARDLAREGH